jgi:hypothetical protein
MPPQNNRQADMQGLNALSILDWLGQSNKHKDWMDVAQETAAQQTAGSPFGTAGTFAPEESGEWEPGLTSLLPTGPVDMAVETILSGIMQDNPKLGIALGLFGAKYGPKIAKGIDVAGGAALSRSQYRKGFKQAKRDPMQRKIPFAGESSFVPFTGEFAGRYNQMPGWALIRHGASTAVGGKPFTFAEYSLSNMLKNPNLIRKQFMPSTVFHEGRHYLQHKATSGGKTYGTFKGVVRKPKNPPATHESLVSQHRARFGGPEGALEYKKHIEYLSNPIEVEARLEQITMFGVKNSPFAIQDLQNIGYTHNQISSMLKAYRKERQAAFPATY